MSIVENRKAFHDYFIEERYEAGLALKLGRSRRSAAAGEIGEGYVMVRATNLLIGATSYRATPAHITPDPSASRKLLFTPRRSTDHRKGEQRGSSLCRSTALRQGAN